MKHTFRIASVAAILAGVVLTGCGGSATTSGSTARLSCLTPGAPVGAAIGERSNSPSPNLTSQVLTAMNSAVSAHKTIAVVRIDGSPTVVYNQAYQPSGANSQSQKQSYNAYISNLKTVLNGTGQPSTDVRAQVPQADVLKALNVAASEVPSGGNVIVMDSGLQTTAPLDFATGLLSDDPQTIVSYLRQQKELPALSGRHVEFVGLGYTASPQPALGIAYENRINQIWDAIASAGGASCVVNDREANTNEAVSGRPQVTVMTPPPLPKPPIKCSVTNLDDANKVGFKLGTTTFRSPAGARTTLSKLANVMTSSGESVTLTGATSSEGSDSLNQRLSLERAEAVKTVLVQEGVPASRITTRGDGSHLPGRLNDRGRNGQLLIGAAIQNRKVVARLTGSGCPRG